MPGFSIDLGEIAGLDDPAVLDDEDLVRPADGRQAMGDDERRPSVERDVERALDGVDDGVAHLADGDVAAALQDAASNLGGKHLWANSEMRRLLHASWETSRTELSQSEAVTLVRALLNRNRG